MNPLSAIYSAGITSKNRLYDAGVLKTERLSGPVISVGNLSVGGSGKTPFVILLGKLLQDRGIPFNVLSRGYGRKTRGILEVDPNGSPEQFGDEPLLIARCLSCPVIVGESRYHAGLHAEKQTGARLHILDDGFQHRALARDFDIVLLTPEDLQDRLLPTGRLREPLSSLKRADAVVMTSDVNFTPSARTPIWRILRSVEIPNPPKSPVAFCGIARPQKFVEQLRALGVEPVATKFYRDHHAYSEADVRELLALRERSGAAGFITTEKDEINLGSQIERLGAISVARVRMDLAEPTADLDTILSATSEHKPPA